MHYTIVSATPFEIAPLIKQLDDTAKKVSDHIYELEDTRIDLLITGVGMPLTALNLGRYLAHQAPDLLINAGIAGSYKRDIPLESVVHVISERFGDIGAETAEGDFLDVHEMGLIPSDAAPFQNGQLNNPGAGQFEFLPRVSGLTVNKVHGYPPSIEKTVQKYLPDVETMEGAAFFLACLQAERPFLEIRAISNYVEARNRDSWQIGPAIEQLNATLWTILQSLLKVNQSEN